MAMNAVAAFATPVWQTGSYVPSEWAPSGDNLLARAAVTNVHDGLVAYTENGKNMLGVAGLFDGGVAAKEGTTVDYTKVVGVKSGTVVWKLGDSETFDVFQIKVFTCWGDGGRDGIALGNVEVSSDNANWTVVSPGIEYGTKQKDNNNSSAGALFAQLSDDGRQALAEKVSFIRLNFPASQDNGGAGYVEIEVCGTLAGRPLAVVGIEALTARSATVVSTVKLTGSAEACDLYFAYGKEAGGLSPQRVATGLGIGATYELKLRNLEHNTVYRYEAFLMSGPDNKSETITGTFRTPVDPCRYLPEEYVQVEYIRTSGTQCVNTGVKSSRTLAAELDFIPHAYTGDSYLGYKGIWRFFQSPTTSHNAAFDLNGKRIGLTEGVRLSLNTRYFVSAGNCYLNIHDERRVPLSGIQGESVVADIAAGDVYLAASGDDAGFKAPVAMTLYSLVMKEGDSVVRDFVPCSNKVDKLYGLYDVQEKKFYPFVGDELNALVAGPEVPPLVRFGDSGFRILIR